MRTSLTTLSMSLDALDPTLSMTWDSNASLQVDRVKSIHMSLKES